MIFFSAWGPLGGSACRVWFSGLPWRSPLVRSSRLLGTPHVLVPPIEGRVCPTCPRAGRALVAGLFQALVDKQGVDLVWVWGGLGERPGESPFPHWGGTGGEMVGSCEYWLGTIKIIKKTMVCTQISLGLFTLGKLRYGSPSPHHSVFPRWR